MTYTIIGSGDLYNQSREKTWCPWTQPPSEISSGDDDGAYHIPILGNPSAPIDFTHLDDLASFIVQTLLHPEVSTNQELNFVSDRVSFETIATLLEKYSGRKVIRDIMPLETVHRVMRDPENVPKQLGYAPEEHKSAMPVDFWFLVRGVQGEGRFLMDPGKVSNGLFPGVGVTTFEEYIRGLCT